MAGQLLEAFVEAHGAGHVCGHGCLVVVDPYLPGDAAEPGERSHQTLTGVLGVTARRRHDVEAPRVAQHADGNMDSLGSPGDGHDHFAPVMLQLFGGLGLEPYRGAAGSQGALGLDVGTQDANLAVVSQGLDLAVDDHGVEDPGLEQLVHRFHVGLELGVPLATALAGRSSAPLKSTANRLAMHPETLGNVAPVDPLLM